nr:7TM GPCR domain containing protein [Haemonchus contortus]
MRAVVRNPMGSKLLGMLMEEPYIHAIQQFGSCHLSKYWSSRRKHDEVNFLKQASSRALLFAMGIIVYYFLPYYFTSRWVKFLFGPVNWVSVLTADGLITIIYSRDLRPAFKNQVSRESQLLSIPVIALVKGF